MYDVVERVARGAEWLDEVKPGWAKLTDLGTLDLRSSSNCVMGQLGLWGNQSSNGRLEIARGFYR